MTAALAHRAPTPTASTATGRSAWGHRRLSVIDLAGSRQPLVSATARSPSCSTASSTTSARCGRSCRPRGTCSRHRATARCSSTAGGSGARPPRPDRRDVRVRAVGPRPARGLPRPRPPRRQAALLRVARRRARLRLRDKALLPFPACRVRSTSTRWPSTSSASTSRRRTRSTAASASCRPGTGSRSATAGSRPAPTGGRPTSPKHDFAPAAPSTRSTPNCSGRSSRLLVADVPLGAFRQRRRRLGGDRSDGHPDRGPPDRHVQPRLPGSAVGSEHAEAERVAAHIGSATTA